MILVFYTPRKPNLFNPLRRYSNSSKMSQKVLPNNCGYKDIKNCIKVNQTFFNNNLIVSI